jgi:hypothetical protein
MSAADKKVRVYEELANLEHQQGAPQARDRFLMLAADAALAAGLNEEAERFRARLLEHNPHHLLKPFVSLADALKSSEVYGYVVDLREKFPLEEAERLLNSAHTGSREEKSEDIEPSTPPHRPSEGVPAHLPDPPPLETYRFLKEPAGADSSPASGKELPAATPPLFSTLRESETTPAAAPARRTITVRQDTTVTEPIEPSSEFDETEENQAGMSAWISDALFIVLLLAGLALAGYSLARPFLSLPDSPFK